MLHQAKIHFRQKKPKVYEVHLYKDRDRCHYVKIAQQQYI